MHRARSVSSPRRRSRRPVAGAAALLLCLSACSGAHRGQTGTATSLPPGTITVDRWSPPALSGGPSLANFCAALTAVYRHMADLPHVVSRKVSKEILSDYVSYAPTVIAESPPDVRGSASLYVGTVSAYLHQLVRADLDMGRLTSGALQPLTSPSVDAAYSSLSGYAQTKCHYTIGGTSNPS